MFTGDFTGTTGYCTALYYDYACPVCGRKSDTHGPAWLCLTCAEVQRLLPRKLRRNLDVLRQALDDFETILRQARCRFHPPSWVWRVIAPVTPPLRSVRLTQRIQRLQARLPKICSQQAARRLRAGHLRPKRKNP